MPPNDPAAERLKGPALAAKDDPAAVLGLTDIYGELGRAPAFAEAFARALGMLWRDGARATLARYLEGGA